MAFKVGNNLVGSYDYSDADGDLEGTSTFQWYRADDGVGTNEAAIGGATSTTYTVVDADGGKYLRFGVTPVALTGTSPGTEAFSGYSEVTKRTLTEVASATAGSPVAGISTGAFTIDTEKTYLVMIGVDHQSGTTVTRTYVGGDTTDANYARGYHDSAANINTANFPAGETATNSGGDGLILMTMRSVDGDIFMTSISRGETNLINSVAAHNDTVAGMGEVEITTSVETGTYIKVWEYE